MKICPKCGADLADQAVVCPTCGASIQGGVPASPQDNGGFGWGLLGFCIPVVGLVLFLVWKDSMPRRAKSAGVGALASVIAGVVFYIIYIIIIAIAFAGMNL